jgi:hypothetical protein
MRPRNVILTAQRGSGKLECCRGSESICCKMQNVTKVTEGDKILSSKKLHERHLRDFGKGNKSDIFIRSHGRN